jgi:glutamate transport system permease protein
VNRDVADRLWIFLVFAIGYIILVEIISALSIALERRWRVVSR